jgi:hypothetical protein
MKKKYEKLDFKIPIQSDDYKDNSVFVIEKIEKVIADRINSNG